MPIHSGGAAGGAPSKPQPAQQAAQAAPEPAAPQPPKPAGKPPSAYPDHQLLGMPALSPTMSTGNIVEWTKKVWCDPLLQLPLCMCLCVCVRSTCSCPGRFHTKEACLSTSSSSLPGRCTHMGSGTVLAAALLSLSCSLCCVPPWLPVGCLGTLL